MGHGHDGPPPPTPGRQAMKVSEQVTVLGSRGSPRRLTKFLSQPSAPLARFARSPLPGALVVARTHPGPRCQILCRGKLSHVYADLPDNSPGRHAIYAWNRIQQRGGLTKTWHLAVDLLLYGRQLLFQKLQLLPILLQ